MNWLSRMRGWFGPGAAGAGAAPRRGGETHLDRAADSLRALIEDRSIPKSVREALADDYAEIQALLDKLEQDQLHVAVFGRVSVGKSALLNALAGRDAFASGVLHGTTVRQQRVHWDSAAADAPQLGALVLIDTPGIDELDGEQREALAHEIAERADLVLFVVDADMTAVEHRALGVVAVGGRPLLLVLNKADRYTDAERAALLARLGEHAAGRVRREHIVPAMAAPAPERVLRETPQGEQVVERERGADVEALRRAILTLMEREGRSFAALNAALAAGRLSDAVGARLIALRRAAADRIVHAYCLAKGVAVALNPVPVADLLAAAALDVALVAHLGRVYGMPPSRAEAGRLLAVILGQLAALMGAVWGVHLVASALKLGTGGLSTVATAGAQGALAWYATYVVGRVAERWYAQGRSWGPQGPKQVVREIVESLDRDSILREARAEILGRLRGRDADGGRRR
uniref:GTP-binding protein n=1 Tax=Coralloluteibacterium stylophorae TaxID=1776034 RepID=A0A8J7VQP0_9GAMM